MPDHLPEQEQVERFWLWRRRQWTDAREYGPWHVETNWSEADAEGMRVLASDDPQVLELMPVSDHEAALQSQRQLTEKAEAERDTAWFHVRALLQIRIPPRNEPGIDDAVVRAAREALPK